MSSNNSMTKDNIVLQMQNDIDKDAIDEDMNHQDDMNSNYSVIESDMIPKTSIDIKKDDTNEDKNLCDGIRYPKRHTRISKEIYDNVNID